MKIRDGIINIQWRKNEGKVRKYLGSSEGTARGQSGDMEVYVAHESPGSGGQDKYQQLEHLGLKRGNNTELHLSLQEVNLFLSSFVRSLQLHCFVCQRLKVSRCSSVRPDVCSPPTVFLPPHRPVPLEQFLSLHSRCKHRYEQ